MDSTLYISHPTLYVAYTDVYCVSSDERLSAMMSKRWVIGWKLWKESYKKQFSELIYRVLRGVYGTGHWSFLIPHIDPDLGLYTICLDICARAQNAGHNAIPVLQFWHLDDWERSKLGFADNLCRYLCMSKKCESQGNTITPILTHWFDSLLCTIILVMWMWNPMLLITLQGGIYYHTIVYLTLSLWMMMN
jgi:hypothetical protein